MSEAARRKLIEEAKRRKEEQGRRGLRRRAPRPRSPEQQIRQYRAALRTVTGAIEREMRDRLFPEVESIIQEAGTREDSQAKLDDWGDKIADLFLATRRSIEPAIEQAQVKMMSLGDETTERATDEQIKAIRTVLGVSPSFYDDDRVSGILNAWKRQNDAFITRMADDEIQDIQDAASRAVRSGKSNREVKDAIRKRFKISDNRAQRIARTEISQLNAQITRERQREVGINGYYWSTAGDERVRDSHEEMEGRFVPWDDPPSETGGSHAGEAVNCRCSSRPAVDRLLDELEAV